MPHRRSSRIRLVRRACRNCRNYTTHVVSPCPSCGAIAPRIRASAIPIWLGVAVIAVAALAWMGMGPGALLIATR